ncbi:MAG: M23 family metallopeptidase [Thermoanaerobaculia bacterium]
MAIFNLFLASVIFPLFGIALLFRRSRAPFPGWFATFFFATGLVGFSFLAAPWGWFGLPLRYLLLFLYLGAVVASIRRPIPAEVVPDGFMRTAAKMLIGIFFGGVALSALQARSKPAESIELRFPLRNGSYLIGHGGSTSAANFHSMHPSQRFALDIMKLTAFGTRARGLSPTELTRYAVFGAAIYSPCNGKVAAAVDGFPDNNPPMRDEKNLAGNHVAIQCGEAVVYIAHLQKGSVAVKPGAPVTTETLLGRVGNSGNTTEPHLHVHAEKGRYTGKFSGFPGLAATYDGAWPVRNDIVRR